MASALTLTLTRLLFYCASTVSEPDPFQPAARKERRRKSMEQGSRSSFRPPRLARRSTRACRVENQLLHAPGGDFRNKQLIFIPAIDLMHRAEFTQFLSRAPELDEDRSVQLPAGSHVTSVGRSNVLGSAVPVAGCGNPSTASWRLPRTIVTQPSGLNLMTMLVPSSTAQMLSCGSTRDGVREREAVQPLAELANEVALLIELEQAGLLDAGVADIVRLHGFARFYEFVSLKRQYYGTWYAFGAGGRAFKSPARAKPPADSKEFIVGRSIALALGNNGFGSIARKLAPDT